MIKGDLTWGGASGKFHLLQSLLEIALSTLFVLLGSRFFRTPGIDPFSFQSLPIY